MGAISSTSAHVFGGSLRTDSNFRYENMTQVDHSESDVMSTQAIGIFAVVADQQGAELVDPGETAFTGGEAALVDLRIEQTLAPAPGPFPIAGVLRDVGHELVIEADLTRLTGIKGGIGIEIGACNRQAKSLHGFEGRL